MGQGFATVSERGILNKYGKGKTTLRTSARGLRGPNRRRLSGGISDMMQWIPAGGLARSFCGGDFPSAAGRDAA